MKGIRECFLMVFFFILAGNQNLLSQNFLTKLKEYVSERKEVSLKEISLTRKNTARDGILGTYKDPRTGERIFIDQEKAQRLLRKRQKEELIEVEQSENAYYFKIKDKDNRCVMLVSENLDVPDILIDFKNNRVKVKDQKLDFDHQVEVDTDDNVIASQWNGISWKTRDKTNKGKMISLTVGLTRNYEKLYLEITEQDLNVKEPNTTVNRRRFVQF